MFPILLILAFPLFLLGVHPLHAPKIPPAKQMIIHTTNGDIVKDCVDGVCQNSFQNGNSTTTITGIEIKS